MLTIKGEPDYGKINNKREINVAGRNWSDSIRNALNQTIQNPAKIICLNMDNIDFISMFEWVSVLATIDKILLPPFTNSFAINFLSTPPTHSLKPNMYIGILKNEPQYNSITISDQELKDIDRLYRLTGFLESLRTLKIINRFEIGEKLEYQWIDPSAAQTRAFYSSEGNKKKQTTLLGLTHIASKAHCKSFLDEQQIRSWREAMEGRFRRSPLLRLDEVWRVIFHELAVNIWEHSETSGFISSRIVLPYKGNEVKNIWKYIFPDIKDEHWPIFKGGMLEICVADAGKGIVNTLRGAFIDNHSVTEDDTINDKDILSFAFDELGTSKTKEKSWVTERHALGRILSIVSKYGGSLTIRSGMAEICYVTKGGLFEHLPFHRGYNPTYFRELSTEVKGTQVQILLPLFPQVNVPLNKRQGSVLEIPLPNTFTTDSVHPRGHLVPLREALTVDETTIFASIGAQETLEFKRNCEKVVRQLVKSYADSEAIVFDFSGVQWTAAQFETFVYCFQNIIQNRPTLIVELNSQLAAEIKTLEHNNSNTTLDPTLLKQTPPGLSGNVYDEVAEQKFLEINKSVNAPLLTLDEKGSKHIFALPSMAYEDLLLSLIDKPNTINGLCYDRRWRHIISKVELELILHNINPLFIVDETGKWRCVWDNQKLSVEMNRVMSLHFDKIAERSGAWIGKSLKDASEDDIHVRFNLSWQKEWRNDFLESSKILSRERYADEAAQRLIFRLQKGLAHINQSLKDIHVLACPTGPAMLLATALHKWWPEDEKPIVADMSYYALLGDTGQLPMLLEGEVIIVQDILDQGTISGELIKAFQELEIKVVCVIGLIRLVKAQRTRITSIFDGWELSENEKEEKKIPTHAMIETKGPEKCEPPAEYEDDTTSFWIEPRALYPIKYPHLRREFAPGRDADLDRRNKFLPHYFDSPITGCLFASGHYVYGQRHYAVAVNVRKTLSGQLGDEIANWLADICLGNSSRQDVPWETQGKSLVGSVTAVLMPLHSQIHYLWPKVSNILAQFGRRQPVWLLDATLFTGTGAAYRLPAQFIAQIKSAVKKSIDAQKNGEKTKNTSLRLLILDDAMTTGRTAETILGAITREVEKSCNQHNTLEKTLSGECVLPIEWIRYFAIFSQLGYARHLLWKNIKYLDGITFTVEEFAPFMGVPVYDEKNCPICRDRRRLERLIARCKRLGALHTSSWAATCLEETFPIAIDSPWGQGKEPEYIETGINILGIACGHSELATSCIPKHTDTAIWRFYEYMYLSYPIGDFLIEIKKSWERTEPFPQLYRWTVVEWCLRNWPRVKASTAKDAFLVCVIKELENSTDLLEKILEASTQHFSDSTIKSFVKQCIICFASADKEYLSKKTSDSTITYLMSLEIGLHAFFLHIPKIVLGDTYSPEEDTELIDVVKTELEQIGREGPSFLKNLYARLIRPRRVAKPDWSLNVIAEALLRGRNPAKKTGDGHHLLPGLIDRVLTSWRHMDWMLLQGSITLFKAALNDLSPYTTIDPSFGDQEGGQVKQLCDEIIKWYDKYSNLEEAQKNSPKELGKLLDTLDINEKFIEKINGLFHPEMIDIKSFLEDRKQEKDKDDLLDFKFVFDQDTKQCRCLVLSSHLMVCLANISIDHIAYCQEQHKSRITCSRNGTNTDRIYFRILTNFTDHKEATSNLISSRHFAGERNILQSFGVVFATEWAPPSGIELKDGFRAAFELSTPSGYLPRRQ